ncbi:CopG family ribbon-helix-helix protein [Metapseudomonas furukawaii]|uniref:CopG family ribbon-helix-helix protein n=1 Tax=Metapseudomonas furukawaii TaxID=1149133 RepID=UPI000559DB6D|nr:transcriptional regulator [Pseudomonas furukawaii]
MDDGRVNRLNQLAAATNRDRLYHLKPALSRYLDAESWHVEAIQEGLRDAEAGNLTDIEAVKAKWVKRANDLAD